MQHYANLHLTALLTLFKDARMMHVFTVVPKLSNAFKKKC